MSEFEQRLKKLEDGYEELKSLIDENTKETKEAKAISQRIIELIEGWEAAMKVLEGIGRFFRPLGFVAAALAAILGLIATVKNGISPK